MALETQDVFLSLSEPWKGREGKANGTGTGITTMTRTIRLVPMIGTVPAVEAKAILSMLDSGGNRCRRGGIRGLTLRFEGSTQNRDGDRKYSL